VVVKEQSVYVANPETRVVKQIDTRGLGGSAGFAVAVTARGVVFINASGVYRLNRDLSITHVSRMVTGTWRGLNQANLAVAHAHHYAIGRRVKISVPSAGSQWPDQVLVYDYDRESLADIGAAGQSAVGAWTLYTNHPARGWANLADDAYWASTAGDVFLVRNRGDATDYRDEADAVAEAVVQLKAEDFDLPGIRKVIVNVTTEVELETSDVTDLQIETAQSLSRTFETAATVSLSSADFRQLTFRASPPTRRGTHIQARYTHQHKDEVLRLTGVIYTVAQLGYKLVKESVDV
jgi:hypothetical protein